MRSREQFLLSECCWSFQASFTREHPFQPISKQPTLNRVYNWFTLALETKINMTTNALSSILEFRRLTAGLEELPRATRKRWRQKSRYYHSFPWFATLENKTAAETQNFRQSCVLSTERIEIHQSQPLVWPSDLLYVMLAVCDWWISIRSVDNMCDWRKFRKCFRGCFVFQSRESRKTVVMKLNNFCDAFARLQQHWTRVKVVKGSRERYVISAEAYHLLQVICFW